MNVNSLSTSPLDFLIEVNFSLAMIVISCWDMLILQFMRKSPVEMDYWKISNGNRVKNFNQILKLVGVNFANGAF